jgi:hypothetical protein
MIRKSGEQDGGEQEIRVSGEVSLWPDILMF